MSYLTRIIPVESKEIFHKINKIRSTSNRDEPCFSIYSFGVQA